MSDYDFKAARKEELERRLATARRVAALRIDPLSKERVDGFIQELEAELGKGISGNGTMVSSAGWT
jgi:L-rhamnose isomerase